MTVALVLATVAFNILSQALLKGAMQRQQAPIALSNLPKVLFDPWLFGGVAFAGLTLVAYTLTLRRLDLSVAYPIVTGLGFLGVFLASWRLFGEEITLARVVGAALVIGGVSLLATHAGSR
jgi:multidrug transporter EmrE-like cation transporter